ncbi:MAG: hypothetical protein WBG92_12970, partial [Thiohalocapsa sp.]
ELAPAEGITGWPAGAVLDATAMCFEAWLDARGGPVPMAERQLLEQVGLWLEANSSRLRWKSRASDDHAPEVGKAAGFKEMLDENEGPLRLYVLPETFKQEVVKGFNATDAAQLLVQHGVLSPGGDGRTDSKIRLPGYKHPTRCYVFDRLGSEAAPDEL